MVVDFCGVLLGFCGWGWFCDVGVVCYLLIVGFAAGDGFLRAVGGC